MFSSNRIMSDYMVDLADVSTYGCDPVSFEELRDEFEIYMLPSDEFEGLASL